MCSTYGLYVTYGTQDAGLMCGATAGYRGRSVLVLDMGKKPGRKILISGGGRCNFTNENASPENYLCQNPHFVKSALSRYTQHDFIALGRRHLPQPQHRNGWQRDPDCFQNFETTRD